MAEPERPAPGFATGPGSAGSTSDAATETAVSGDAVGGAHDDLSQSAGQAGQAAGAGHPGHNASQRAVPPDVEDTWNADRIDVGPGSMRGDEQGRRTASGDPFGDVDGDDVQADRTGYRKRSGI
jgi:hypothetical protein